ncbi:MAG: phage capsid protein [Bacteroidales bacterium]|nr:phage capsid protein [Bacteroidales bacterium]
MSTPDTIYAKQYGSNVSLLAQQKGSRLRNAVTVKSGVVGEETYMDQLTAFDAQARTSRLSQTNPTLASYARRRIALEDYFIAKAIDKLDSVRTLADPTSAISQNGINGMGRQIDDLIIAAATGTAYTGKVGGTSIVLPSAQKVAVGSSNLTLAKLLSAKEILDGNEVDPSDERYIIVSSGMLSSLLNTTEVKSADYNSVKVLVQGMIDTYLGFKFIRSERLAGGATARKAIAFTKSGIGLAIGRDVTSRIDELPNQHYAKQLYFSMSMGASRLEEAKVVEIACNESL